MNIDERIWSKPRKKCLNPGSLSYEEFLKYYGPILWRRFDSYISEQTQMHNYKMPVMKVKFYCNNKDDKPQTNMDVKVIKKWVIETVEACDYKVESTDGLKRNKIKIKKKIEKDNPGKIVKEDARRTYDDWTIGYQIEGKCDLISVETEVVAEYTKTIPVVGLEIVKSQDVGCQTDTQPIAIQTIDHPSGDDGFKRKIINVVGKRLKSITETFQKVVRVYMKRCEEYSDKVDWLNQEIDLISKENERNRSAYHSNIKLLTEEVEELRKGLNIEDNLLLDLYKRDLNIYAAYHRRPTAEENYRKTGWYEREDDILDSSDRYNCLNDEIDLDVDY